MNAPQAPGVAPGPGMRSSPALQARVHFHGTVYRFAHSEELLHDLCTRVPREFAALFGDDPESAAESALAAGQWREELHRSWQRRLGALACARFQGPHITTTLNQPDLDDPRPTRLDLRLPGCRAVSQHPVAEQDLHEVLAPPNRPPEPCARSADYPDDEDWHGPFNNLHIVPDPDGVSIGSWVPSGTSQGQLAAVVTTETTEPTVTLEWRVSGRDAAAVEGTLELPVTVVDARLAFLQACTGQPGRAPERARLWL
ncbi:MAG: hypothetical protein ACK5MT_00130 [Actinomycetales bacterium]